MEDDYLMDDDEVLDEDGYYNTPEDEEDSQDSDDGIDSEEGSGSRSDKVNYGDAISEMEVKFIGIYDDIVKAGKKGGSDSNTDIVNLLIGANPKHTSSMTRLNIAQEVLNTQGHNRMRNNVYTAETSLSGRDIDEDYVQNDDSAFNAELAKEAREQITRFVDYLASRDLSKDTVHSRNRKQMQLPAFIILMFSTGLYDLIINCPTMPPEYDKQIVNALKRIEEMKYELVEQLAEKYDSVGRHEVAERVRKLKLQWFSKEPAEIKTASDYTDLNITQDDVNIYREYRNKFTNISKSLTQDVISDLIEVIVDKEAGIYKKLKDKTRSTAIEDVKQEYKRWASENSRDSDLAKRIIWDGADAFKN